MLNFKAVCCECNSEVNPTLISDGDNVKIGVVDGKVKMTCTCGNVITFDGATFPIVAENTL